MPIVGSNISIYGWSFSDWEVESIYKLTIYKYICTRDREWERVWWNCLWQDFIMQDAPH